MSDFKTIAGASDNHSNQISDFMKDFAPCPLYGVDDIPVAVYTPTKNPSITASVQGVQAREFYMLVLFTDLKSLYSKNIFSGNLFGKHFEFFNKIIQFLSTKN